MKIVTFNLRMDTPADGPHRFLHRRSAIVQRIRQEAPDILGFQEALPEMYDYLRENLPEYTFVGHGRSENYQGEANPIAFRSDRFALKAYCTRWLSPTPEKPGSRFLEDQSICPRIFVTAELYDRQTASVFRVVNTHLDHEGPIARKRGLELIANAVPDDLPTVLMGDFNCPPTDDALKPLQGRFRDMSEGLGHTFHCFEGWYTWKTDKIDYISPQRNSKNPRAACGKITGPSFRTTIPCALRVDFCRLCAASGSIKGRTPSSGRQTIPVPSPGAQIYRKPWKSSRRTCWTGQIGPVPPHRSFATFSSSEMWKAAWRSGMRIRMC